jgi:phenylalanyl-tRNA synthetase beta chain
MKISYNWLREYLDFDFTPEQLSEILTSTGLEVEGWETYESIKGGLQGIVVGHVLEHTKLDQPGKTISLNTVDVGTGTPLQIICGASRCFRDWRTQNLRTLEPRHDLRRRRAQFGH